MSDTPKPLHLEPGAIEELVGICDDILDGLNTAVRRAEGLKQVSGFGGFESAQQLQRGYELKAAGSADSVYERLEQFRVAVQAMRDAFEAGGDAYADQDSAVNAAINAIAGEISR